jgi:orotidine-5'-phosphate decarboxylase
MFNLHASGGQQMMRTAVEEVKEFCDRQNKACPLMIAVTMLTSSDANFLGEQGIAESLDSRVTRLARLSFEAGMHGVVASAQEVPFIRGAVGVKEFLTVTPGIRSAHATVDDQKRVTTLRAALSSGADYVVIGRPIIESSDRTNAVERMLEELSQ